VHVWEVCVCVWVCYILHCQSYISLVPRPSIQHVHHLQYNTCGTCMMLTMICAGVGSGLGPGTKTSHTWDEVII